MEQIDFNTFCINNWKRVERKEMLISKDVSVTKTFAYYMKND